MLKVIFCADGTCVSDFKAYEYCDSILEEYRNIGDSDLTVRVANETAFSVFVLRAIEGVFPESDIEFYYEDIQLEYDSEMGLIEPDGVVVGLYGQLIDAILKVGYNKMRQRKLAEKGAS